MRVLTRNRWILVLSIFPIFFSCLQAKADADTIRRFDDSVWLSAGGAGYNYKEQNQPPNLPDSERALIASIAAGASDLTPNNIYVALEGNVNFGDATYHGAYLSAPTVPITSTTKETIVNGDGKIAAILKVVVL